jgi:hypothetical protein
MRIGIPLAPTASWVRSTLVLDATAPRAAKVGAIALFCTSRRSSSATECAVMPARALCVVCERARRQTITPHSPGRATCDRKFKISAPRAPRYARQRTHKPAHLTAVARPPQALLHLPATVLATEPATRADRSARERRSLAAGGWRRGTEVIEGFDETASSCCALRCGTWGAFFAFCG